MYTLTYGEFPEQWEFESAWNDEIGFGGTYHVRAGLNGLSLFDMSFEETREYTCDAMWAILKAAETEEELDEVSSVMYTLGFEWI